MSLATSFIPISTSHHTAPQVYNLQDPYYSSNGQWGLASERGEVKGNDADEYSEFSEEAPRPPPPAPTPMIGASDSARPRRLRQTWGGSPSVRGAISDRHGLDATYATNGEDSGDARAFVAPSKLQEASMWSTAVEQAVLERRMREASA